MRPSLPAATFATLLALCAACAHAPPPVAAPPPALPAPVVEAPVEPPAPALPAAAAAPTPAEPASGASPAALAAGPITFAAVGDLMLGTTFPDESKGKLLPPDDGASLLREVAPVLAAADVAFGNLEGPLLDDGPSEKCNNAKPGRCWAFRVPVRYGRWLREAGFDVLSLANNHINDFGEPGRQSTRAALDALGIRYSGAIGEVAHLEVRGARVAVVAFSVSGGTNDLTDLPGAAALVAQARSQADLVVVSFHGGAEGADRQHVPVGPEAFYGENRGDLRQFARTVIDAGAALVIGHGPHVVRGLELYRGHLIAYSLGNFATWSGMNLTGPNGVTLVLEVTVAPDGTFSAGKVLPARQDRPGGPKWDPAREVIPMLRTLSREDFGPSAVDVADDGTLITPEAAPRAGL